MNWDIYAEQLNKIIITAIEHGGDAGGAYFSCHSKLSQEIEKLLYLMADFADYYKVENVYVKDFLTEIPQFVKL